MKSNFDHTQEEELKSWLIEDPLIREDKAQRERIRYPYLKKQMGIDTLDTSKMLVWDIGGGPLGGVSSILKCRQSFVIDPLADEYKKYYPLWNGIAQKAEDLKEKLAAPDLIIITNALDHFDNPIQFLKDLNEYTKYSVYIAMLHAENNAFTHPHEAHQHNVNPEMIRQYLTNFEVVWEMNYLRDGLTYGWRRQPAHSQLLRKVC
jgi:2-polyprenyl-3-methyl-5-hydroxy-6-metoxy-1,4-benzoquinol methylase